MLVKLKFMIKNVDKDTLWLNRKWRFFRENEYKIVYISSVKNPLAMFQENFRLLLFLEYNKKYKIYNLVVAGSIRKWYFGKNVRRDINKKQLKESLSILAKELNILEDKVFNANITKAEFGSTLVLKSIFKLLNKGFVSYPRLKKNEYIDTIYFGNKRTSSYSLILYNKLYETCKKNNKKLLRAVKSKDKIFFCRFEMSLNKISQVDFLKNKTKTFNQLFANWNLVVEEVLNTANKIVFIDSMSDFKVPTKDTRTTSKNRKRYRLIQSKGLDKKLIEIGNEKSNNIKNKRKSLENFVKRNSMGTYKHLKVDFMEKLKLKLLSLC